MLPQYEEGSDGVPGRKVLVVDDEPKIVEIIRLYLQREGFEVKVAGDGRAALEMARKEGAVLRRTAEQPRVQERLIVGSLSLDLARHEARFNSQLLELSPTEFKLLY